MSDVATVAAITGGTSVLTSAITAAVTWTVSKNSASVELAKAKAENERLHEGHREEERRNRQSTYHQMLELLVYLFQALGALKSHDEIEALRERYTHLMSGVVLFGPRSVREGAYELNAVQNQIWVALVSERTREPQKPYPEQWRDATANLKTDFGNAIVELTGLMHADVTRGIADESAS